MWTCPKCGRTFARTNQSHWCGEKPLSVDEYLARQPEDIRPELEQMRGILRRALPDAEERISWSMPTLWQGHNLIHFAAAKHHIGLYPGDAAVRHFKSIRGMLPSVTSRMSWTADMSQAKAASGFPTAQSMPTLSHALPSGASKSVHSSMPERREDPQEIGHGLPVSAAWLRPPCP